MERTKVLLISTKTKVKSKVEVVKKILNIKGKFEILLYTNKQIDELKDIKVVFLNVCKNELQNTALNEENENVILLDLDYSKKTIENVLLHILENIEDYDVINFKNKENEFIKILNNLKYLIYNFILSFFNIQPILNINKDFQYLSKKITKVMANISKSPNYLRTFNNFSGYNYKTIELEKEKVNSTHNILYIILALIMLTLAIISVVLTIILAIKFKASPNVTRMILAEILIFILLVVCTVGSFTYSQYINSI